MPSPAAVLSCVGLCLCLELAACSHLPGGPLPQQAGIEQVLDSRPAERAALWDRLSREANPSVALSLLRSLPGHPGHAPNAALGEIRRWLEGGALSRHERQLLQLRGLGLERELSLSAQLQEREQRLKSLIEIEQRLNERVP